MQTAKYEFTTIDALRRDLKAAMAERGYSATALAPVLGVTTSTLTRFLSGEAKSVRAELRARIVAWLSRDFSLQKPFLVSAKKAKKLHAAWKRYLHATDRPLLELQRVEPNFINDFYLLSSFFWSLGSGCHE